MYNFNLIGIKKRENYFIIKPSIDANYWKSNSKTFTKNSVISVGNLNPTKNHLLLLKAISKIAPKFVVMENVKGMLPYAEQVVEDYKNIRVKKGNKTFSYSVDCKVLVSNDFGVAQKRQRLIFIAIRNDISEKRKITPSGIFQEIENFANLNHKNYPSLSSKMVFKFMDFIISTNYMIGVFFF